MKKAVIFDMYGVLLHQDLFVYEWVDTHTVQVAHEVKEKGFTLILLSNIYVWSSARFKRKYRFLDLFDKLYFSSDVGLAKPDRRIYQLVLDENNLQPEDCIFFDDNLDNVAGAQACGIESYVYEGPEQVREKLSLS